MVDIFKVAGLEQADLSILDDEFLQTSRSGDQRMSLFAIAHAAFRAWFVELV